MYSQPFAAACVDDAPPARQWRTLACENDDLLPTHPDTSSLSPETHTTQFFTTPETIGKDTVIRILTVNFTAKDFFMEKMPEFSSTVLSTLSPYLQKTYNCKNNNYGKEDHF